MLFKISFDALSERMKKQKINRTLKTMDVNQQRENRTELNWQKEQNIQIACLKDFDARRKFQGELSGFVWGNIANKKYF